MIMIKVLLNYVISNLYIYNILFAIECALKSKFEELK